MLYFILHPYLAIGANIFEEFFSRESISLVIEDLQISIVVVNLETEEVTQWIR